MKLLLKFLLVLSVQSLVLLVAGSEGHYVILAPSVVRENSPISLAVSTTGFSDNVNYEATLEKLLDYGGKKRLDSVRYSQQSVNEVIRFKPKFSKTGRYNVQIKGTELSCNFLVQCTQRRPVILIQTDKPVYKPGDTVKYRVLVLDQETRPVADLKTVNVQLRDSDQNLIREWSFAKLRHGVFQSQLDLANFITLGNWTLSVTAKNGQTKQKSFTVAEYVLPNHEIRISCPRGATFQNKTVEILVDASYTFGKPISGRVSVQVDGQNPSQQTTINGRARLTIDLKDATRYDDNGFVFWIHVTATIEETGSAHSYHKSQPIPVYHRSRKVTLRKSSEYFLPEVAFKCWLILTDPHGQPVETPSTVEVEVRRKQSGRLVNSYKITNTPDQNGVLPLSIDTTRSIDEITLNVTYAGEKTDFTIEQAKEDAEDAPAFLTVSLLTERPRMNQSVEVEVRSSFKMESLFYHVISKGEILLSRKLDVWYERKANFSFEVSSTMVPEAALVVFAIDGDVLHKDVVRFDIQELNNFVNLTLSKSTAEPRHRISVNARSSPGSMVGLLAIDKSVLLLGSGHDITKDAVFNELRNWGGRDQKDHGDILKKMGFTLITNAIIPDSDASLFEEGGILDARFGVDEEDDVKQDIVIRKKFPETWLWTEMAAVDSNGRLEISEVVPDTITSWAISGFSLDPVHGLGVVGSPLSLNVLKPFFITVNMPYSIVKTEIALVEVFLYNYLGRELETTVQLWNENEEFSLVNERNLTDASLEHSKEITIPSNSIRKVNFFIKPTKSGFIVITVTAEADTVKDGVQHRLKVTSGGLQHNGNFARFIEVDESTQTISNLQLVIPRSVTPGSENITFSVEGILLSAALSNLEELIRLPTGCGEQNLVKLVPCVIALEYMTNAGNLADHVKTTALEYLRKGYQNQLNYKKTDGSFSTFRGSDYGSTFLTALVAKTFRFAEKHIEVDREVIKEAYNWLKNQQSYDGKFREPGSVFYPSMQGGSNGDISFTAYVLISFLEHKNLVQQYRSVIDQGISYISKNLNRVKKPYDWAIVSYALQLANHHEKDYSFGQLLGLAKSDSNLTKRWWDSGSTSIETAAYALLTYMSKGAYIDAKPIMQWLVSQRYDKGGYDNTQNTFVGLQALAQYSRVMSISRNDYDVTISYGPNQQTLHMDAKSSVRGKHVVLPSDVRSFDVFINGTGAGVFQVAYQYNAPPKDQIPQFRISKTIRESTSRARNILNMNVCARYVPRNFEEEINMVLMEVMLPSGYIVTDDTLDQLKRNKKVKMVETKDDGTHLILYFDPLPQAESVCVDISSFRKAIVLGQIAGWIKVFDYYDPMREVIEYFDATPIDADNMDY